MPRLYFHLRGQGNRLADPIGETVPHARLAKTRASRLARRIVEDSGKEWEGWEVEVTDKAGKQILSLPLKGSPAV